MTTAHRPTFYNAIGGENQSGNFIVANTSKICARDLPGQLTLKRRQLQAASLFTDDNSAQSNLANKELLKRKLELREKEDQIHKSRVKAAAHEPLEAIAFHAETEVVNKIVGDLLPDDGINPFPEDSDDEGPVDISSKRKIKKIKVDEDAENTDDNDDNEEEGDTDDEEEAELLREIQKIKREKEAAEKRQQEEEMKIKTEQDKTRILKANPLLLIDNKINNNGLKRRWDDDVIFKNQAKEIPKQKKRFINDTVRSEFHKKFLAKYIQ